MKSPLRYPGGKTRAIKHLLPHIPAGDICSPFLGGGSLELVLAEDRAVYAYDAFYPLYNFWNCLLTDKDYLVAQVKKLHPLDKETFKALRMLLRGYDPTQGKSVELAGKNGDMHEGFDHKSLHSLLTNRQNWLLCYNDCDFIRQHYADYEIVPAAWAYGMNKSKKSNEVFIISRG